MRPTCGLRSPLISLLLLALLLGLASPALAQDPPALEAQVVADFPTSITFKLRAQGQESITRAVLRYRLERESCFEEIIERHPSYTPAPRAEVSWVWDMRKSGGLPPGAMLTYEWLVSDAQGHRAATPPRFFSFADTRHPWKGVGSGKVALLWYEGNEAFARRLLEAASGAMERLRADTGVEIEQGVRVFIYNGSAALREARVFPQEWEGGVAFPDYGVAALGVAPPQLAWGERAVAHELAHLAIFQASDSCFMDPPPWLSEGIAMWAEGRMEASFSSRLRKAIEEDRLISVRSLSSSFPPDTEAALLSYAQSYSLVDFLVRSYGREKVAPLLRTIGQGHTADEALLQVYGFDSRGLEERWRKDIGAKPAPAPGPSPLLPDPPPPLPGLPGLPLAILVAGGLLLSLSWTLLRKQPKG